MTNQRIPPRARYRRLRRLVVIASAAVSMAAALLVLFWDGCTRSLVQHENGAATYVGTAALDERGGGERR